MERKVSHPATTFYKAFGPIVALTILFGYTLSYFTGLLDRPGGTPGLGWAVLLGAIMALGAIWGSRQMKHVSLDGQIMRVSSWREEALIPLTDVADVAAAGEEMIV